MAKKSFKYHQYLIGKDLGYERVMPDLHTRIYACVTEAEVLRVMTTARHLMCDREIRMSIWR